MVSENEKYKGLLKNTFILALGTFGTKFIEMLLLPLYTRILTTAETGTLDLLVGTCNLVLPMIIVCMDEAIIRFNFEKTVNKKNVYTTSMITLFAGFLLFLLLLPVFQSVEFFSFLQPYIVYVYLYVFMAGFRSISHHFVRSMGYMRLFAVDGVVTTLITLTLNILFIAVFHLGPTGMLLSTIIADFISGMSLTLIAKNYRYFSFKTWIRNIRTEKKGSTVVQMLIYALPLVPTAIFWWVTNMSDRYFIYGFLDESAVGIYNTANKLPMVINLVSTTFIQAWQISAFKESGSGGGKDFFSMVFRSYYTLIFIAASGLMILIKPFILLLDKSYYDSWHYVHFLILAVSFSCLVTFLGTIYNSVKKNIMVTITTALGGAVNITLNAFTIPKWHIQGAVFSTFMSFLVVFIFRAIDTRRYMPIVMRPLRIGISLLLLLGQTAISLAELKYHYVLQGIVFLVIVFINNAQLFDIYDMVKAGLVQVLQKKKQEAE